MPKERQRPGLRVVRRKGSTSLYLRGTVRGIRVFESAGTDDPRLAEEARAKREAELYRAAIHGVRAPTTFAAAAVSYLELEPRGAATRVKVNKLLRHFGAAITCTEIDQQAIDRAARRICRPGAAPATRLREVITPVKAILNHAARRGWVDAPSFERMPAGRARTDWMTPAEAEAQIAAANNLIRPLLIFLFCTGARVDEAITLEWERDVDLQNARAVLRDTKNGTDRIVELPPRAIAAMASLPGRAAQVFRQRRDKPYRATNASRTVPYGGQIRKAWASALQGAGIERELTPHHARHTWATWHYCVHRDPMLLRDDGGWSSISQVERYAKLAPAGLVEDIRQFWGHGRANLVHSANADAASA